MSSERIHQLPIDGPPACSQESGLGATALSNNQLTATGFSYDALGNMLTDGANTYGYNAESEIKSAAGVSYTYDGDGDRMQKSSGKIYWYGAGSEILDESDTSGNFTDEYVFFGGKRIAHRSVSSNTIYYYAEDLLGTTRTMVQAGQTSPCYDADFYPYGGERTVVSTCEQNYKFEGKERDPETGDDYFGARYYSSRLGRWLSADWSGVPAPVPYANLTNPQTLNLYSMVRDNPESFADLDGHFGSMGQYAVTADFNASSSCGEETEGSCSGSAWATYYTDLSANFSGVDNASILYYQQADAEDEQKAQQTSATVTTVKYAATDGGVEILLLARVTGSSYQDFNWVQTVTANDPLPGKPANKSYADTDPGQKTPYYLNPKEQKQGEAIAKANGGSTVFSDRPNRVFSGKAISWRANLSLVGINKNGHFDRLRSFSYGFTLDAKGVHLLPLKETQ